jgi:hypothetical protein
MSKLTLLVDGKMETKTQAYPKSESPYRNKKINIRIGFVFDKTVKLKMKVPMIEM